MASAREAMGMLTAPGVGVARVGRSGDWSFAVGYGDAAGCTTAGLQAASRDGAEAVKFLLPPWHPPSLFSSYKDGVHLCSFGIGEESRRYGSEPDLLVPAWEQVGVLPGGPQSGLRGRTSWRAAFRCSGCGGGEGRPSRNGHATRWSASGVR
jgi:hypothetical protein